MDVRSRLSDNSCSSQEQDVGKTDTSSNDEEGVITHSLMAITNFRSLWSEGWDEMCG